MDHTQAEDGWRKKKKNGGLAQWNSENLEVFPEPSSDMWTKPGTKACFMQTWFSFILSFWDCVSLCNPWGLGEAGAHTAILLPQLLSSGISGRRHTFWLHATLL